MTVWKDIPGYEEIYQISEEAEIKSLRRLKTIGDKTFWTKERILKTSQNGYGYICILLYNNGKEKWQQVHRLLAITFIPNPENKPTVNHINGIKYDNRLSNLEWATHSEQMLHAYKLGLNPVNRTMLGVHGKNHYKSLAVIQYDKNMKEIARFESISDAWRAGAAGNVGSVARVCRGLQKMHRGCIWKWDIAFSAGQISDPKDELYSEDLY